MQGMLMFSDSVMTLERARVGVGLKPSGSWVTRTWTVPCDVGYWRRADQAGGDLEEKSAMAISCLR